MGGRDIRKLIAGDRADRSLVYEHSGYLIA